MPTALVIRAPGTNCDTEMARAFALAGCERCDLLHLDRLIADPAAVEAYDLIGFPGGFSYGDDVASGRVFAMRLRTRLYTPLQAAVDRGVCVIGACNGFQVLVQVGLLPGATNPKRERGAPAPPAPPEPPAPPALTVALTDNIGNRFIDQWVRVEPEAASVCAWTKGLGAAFPAEAMTLPIAHGEGRFVTASTGTLESLEAGGQVALRYADNINGSTGRIAGICDPTGRVFGLMPHPERYLSWHHHPFSTALPVELKKRDTPGLRMFKNAVEAVAGAGTAR